MIVSVGIFTCYSPRFWISSFCCAVDYVGVQSASISLLWNGSKLPPLALQIGLRQGDLLSPYLFVLCMELLAIQIKKSVDEATWQPIYIAKEGIGIPNLFFADVVLLIFQAKVDQMHLVANILQDVCST